MGLFVSCREACWLYRVVTGGPLAHFLFLKVAVVRKASDKLYEIITPVVEALGYELVGIEYISQGKHSVLRLYIDSEKGIVVDDCAEVSHQVSGVLDVEDPVKGVYHLEVSSPGLDRPLFNEEHYERFAGHQAKIQLTAPLNGRRKFQGVLLGLKAGGVAIVVDDTEYLLPFASIDKANLVPEF